MTLEEIKARLVAINARINAILAGARDEARTLSVDENAEYIQLEGERGSLESSERIMENEACHTSVASLEPVQQRRMSGSLPGAPAVLRTTRAQRNGDAFEGHTFVKYIADSCLAKVRGMDLGAVAARHVRAGRPELPALFRQFSQLNARNYRAANEIEGGGITTGEWGAELVNANTYLGDFVSYLRSKTIFDQLGLREVPANVAVKGQDGTGAAYWTGEGLAIKMSENDFNSVNLAPLKVGALSAISIELVEDSSPNALQLIRDSLVADSAQLIDTTFFSATAASNGVSPAGMVNGVSGTASAGVDLNGFLTDLDVLVQSFITANNYGPTVLVSRPATAQKVAGFVSFAGTPVYANLNENGGTVQNRKWMTSGNVVSGDLLLVKPDDVFKIGDGGITVDVSTDATLEFSSAPTGAGLVPTGQSAQPISLFQSGMVGVRLLRRINWAKRRASAVARITGTAYVPGQVVSTA